MTLKVRPLQESYDSVFLSYLTQNTEGRHYVSFNKITRK
jgi:hypothetical protein